MVMERIADFLKQLLVRNDQLLEHHHDHKERHHAMSATLQTILSKLNDQGSKISAQGEQINKLIADRDAKEQADLDQIDALLDSNAKASDANAAKVADALAPATSTDTSGSAAPVTASVAAATTAPTSTVVVTGDAPIPVDSALAGPGIAPGTTASDVAVTTAVDGSAVSTITLSQPTTDDHTGDQSETITATPVPAAS